MVPGFETAKRTPSIASPSPSPSRSDPVLEPPAALDDGHTANSAHILSHVITTGTESLRSHNMRSQDGEVEGRPPYLHVRSLTINLNAASPRRVLTGPAVHACRRIGRDLR